MGDAEMTSKRLTSKQVEEAASFFGRLGNLCFLEGSITNTGFAAAISFNSAEFKTEHGVLDLALRNASLTFHVPVSDARWHDELSEFVRSGARSIQIRDSFSRKEVDGASDTLDATVEGKGTFKFLLGDISLGSRISQARKKDRSNEESRSSERVATRTVNDLEMQRSATAFTLHFRSDPDSDLIRYNPQLGRLNVLVLETPSELKAEDVTVRLSAELIENDAEVQHSLRVRNATGCWSGLQASANHQIIGELVLSKLLRPLHSSTQIWPGVRRED